MSKEPQPQKRSFFQTIDIFGKKINMTFEKKTIYKTSCGGVATSILILILGAIFTSEMILIFKGKLDHATYMIRNDYTNHYRHRKKPRPFKKKMKEAIIGYAFEDPELNNSGYFNISSGFSRKADGSKGEGELSLFGCTDLVYSKMSKRTRQLAPKNLVIRCLRSNPHLLLKGMVPSITIKECSGGAGSDHGGGSASPEAALNGCKTFSQLDKKLKNFKIWVFILSDESDFTLDKTKLDSNFIAKTIRISNKFAKKAIMVLREVEIDLERGVLMKRVSGEKPAHMFLRNEENFEDLNFERGSKILTLELIIDHYSKIVITKTFKSITDAMALIGGLSKSISLILFIFVWPVREVSFYKDMINKMFSVCVDKEQCNMALRLAKHKQSVLRNEGDGEFEDENGLDFDDLSTIDYDEFVDAIDGGMDKTSKIGLMDAIEHNAKVNRRDIRKKLTLELKNYLDNQGGFKPKFGFGRGDKKDFWSAVHSSFAKISSRAGERTGGVSFGKRKLRPYDPYSSDFIAAGLSRWLSRARRRMLDRILAANTPVNRGKLGIQLRGDLSRSKVDGAKKSHIVSYNSLSHHFDEKIKAYDGQLRNTLHKLNQTCKDRKMRDKGEISPIVNQTGPFRLPLDAGGGPNIERVNNDVRKGTRHSENQNQPKTRKEREKEGREVTQGEKKSKKVVHTTDSNKGVETNSKVNPNIDLSNSRSNSSIMVHKLPDCPKETERALMEDNDEEGGFASGRDIYGDTKEAQKRANEYIYNTESRSGAIQHNIIIEKKEGLSIIINAGNSSKPPQIVPHSVESRSNRPPKTSKITISQRDVKKPKNTKITKTHQSKGSKGVLGSRISA